MHKNCIIMVWLFLPSTVCVYKERDVDSIVLRGVVANEHAGPYQFAKKIDSTNTSSVANDNCCFIYRHDFKLKHTAHAIKKIRFCTHKFRCKRQIAPKNVARLIIVSWKHIGLSRSRSHTKLYFYRLIYIKKISIFVCSETCGLVYTKNNILVQRNLCWQHLYMNSV